MSRIASCFCRSEYLLVCWRWCVSRARFDAQMRSCGWSTDICGIVWQTGLVDSMRSIRRCDSSSPTSSETTSSPSHCRRKARPHHPGTDHARHGRAQHEHCRQSAGATKGTRFHPRRIGGATPPRLQPRSPLRKIRREAGSRRRSGTLYRLAGLPCRSSICCGSRSRWACSVDRAFDRLVALRAFDP